MGLGVWHCDTYTVVLDCDRSSLTGPLFQTRYVASAEGKVLRSCCVAGAMPCCWQR